jgi:hypothetical protein
MAVLPWPELPERHRWAVELMEECLERTTQGPGELLERAAELRFAAGRTDIDGYRDAHLALADRYEQAAARRRKSA